MELRELIQKQTLIVDGAMGTMLQKSGLKLGEAPEVFNMTSPDVIRDIHSAYLNAGAQLVLTNTFGANELKLASTPYSVEEVVAAAVQNAKAAVLAGKTRPAFVGLDIGPIGQLLEPMGTLSFEEAYAIFQRQVVCGVAAGADAIWIETMTDLSEARAAVLAAKENSSLPVFCTMSFEQDMRTFTGCSLQAMALTLSGLGVDALGINCSLGPVELYPMAQELVKWTNLPVILKPNAGLPTVRDGQTVYDITPDVFVDTMEKIFDAGACILGGCCGTTPDYITMLHKRLHGRSPAVRKPVSHFAVCSASRVTEIDRVRIIGERINPTGKKLFQQALRDGNLDYIIKQAIDQVEAGADILDVNVGLPGIDEQKTMVTVVKKLQSVVDVPLQIDSSNAEVIEAALRVYTGKPIVNSVNGDPDVMQRVLPLVKKYGACVVGLTLDEAGIPKQADARFQVAQRLLNAALAYGIPKEDLLIDCLTLTTSAEQESAYETLKALRRVKRELGLKTVLGVSNISFGLPAREVMNQTFLTMALENGLDLPIINPNVKAMVDTIFCYHQLMNLDPGSHEYITHFQADRAGTLAGAPQQFANPSGQANSEVPYQDIGYCIAKGLREETRQCCKVLLETTDELALVEKTLIPILDEVGTRYEKGEIFLPQLMQSAEAAKAAFELVRQNILKKSGGASSQSRGKILLATVKGDIHDIGKNIVKVVLENYGYDVLDLGRDVSTKAIVESARSNRIQLVGLSALMTTTVSSMQEAIAALRNAEIPCKIMVGGAVLTERYASEIHADYYAKDAQAAVQIAKEVFA